MAIARWMACLLCLAKLVTAGEVSVGFVSGTTSGDKHRRDDVSPFRTGLEASLEYGQGLKQLVLDWKATREGNLAFSLALGDEWRVKGKFIRSRRFSDTSAYPERTPLGTPVDQLYPFSNSLEAAFGGLEPVLTRNRLELELNYGRPWQGLSLWLRRGEQSGERTAQIGSLAFGDFSGPAFFPASLSILDTWRWDLGLRGYLKRQHWFLTGNFTGGRGSSKKTSLLPTFGRSRLLDITAIAEKNDDDTNHASVAGGYQGQRLTVVVTGAYSRVKGTPGFAYGFDGLAGSNALTNASSKAFVRSTAGTLTYRPLNWLSLRLTGRMRTQTSRAQGEEQFFAPGLGHSSDKLEETSGEAEVQAQWRALRLRLAGGVSEGTRDAKQVHAPNLVDYSTDQSRRWFASQLVWRFDRTWQLRLVGRHKRTTNSVDLADLVRGYVLGDEEARHTEARIELRKKAGSWDVGLVWARARAKEAWQPPFYDPIYDPSWLLEEASGRVERKEALVHATYTGSERWSAWLEGGYRDDSWQFGEVTFPGFFHVSERVKGGSVAAGCSVDLSESSHLQVSGSWQEPSETQAHQWGWLDATWLEDLGKDTVIFLRAFTRTFDEERYERDDFTLKAFSVGIKKSF